jgi:2-polyprenyl-3-methyl-5-hydroxy-6-metoxy-1,4-benzoquinol methylase
MNDPFIEIDCPVCGSREHKVFFSLTPDEFLNEFRKSYYKLDVLGIGLKTKLYFKQCRQCSFVFVNPRFRDTVYDKAYNEAKEDQYEINDWKSGPGEVASLYNTHSKNYAAINLLEVIAYFKSRFSRAKNIGQKPITLLDYGCGFGHILDLCRPFGIEGVGVEIDRKRIAFCKEKGLEVYLPDELPKERLFDTVISWSVIEHVNDLNEYFRYISDRLSPGGLFMVHGLNEKIIYWERLRRDFRYVMPIEHINYFTRRSMKQMAAKHGFEIVSRMKIVQSIDSLPRFFYPLAKLFFRGFYPNGVMKLELIKK